MRRNLLLSGVLVVLGSLSARTSFADPSCNPQVPTPPDPLPPDFDWTPLANDWCSQLANCGFDTSTCVNDYLDTVRTGVPPGGTVSEGFDETSTSLTLRCEDSDEFAAGQVDCRGGCGDGTCDPSTEDCNSCPQDCGPCPDCCGTVQCGLDPCGTGRLCNNCPPDPPDGHYVCESGMCICEGTPGGVPECGPYSVCGSEQNAGNCEAQQSRLPPGDEGVYACLDGSCICTSTHGRVDGDCGHHWTACGQAQEDPQCPPPTTCQPDGRCGCSDSCCGDPCCGDPCCGDPCCGDPCCGNPCCRDPCCGDPCCGDPCCGDPCCGDPCCGDPCCGDPCCGDPCCGDPCCGDPECCGDGGCPVGPASWKGPHSALPSQSPWQSRP